MSFQIRVTNSKQLEAALCSLHKSLTADAVQPHKPHSLISQKSQAIFDQFHQQCLLQRELPAMHTKRSNDLLKDIIAILPPDQHPFQQYQSFLSSLELQETWDKYCLQKQEQQQQEQNVLILEYLQEFNPKSCSPLAKFTPPKQDLLEFPDQEEMVDAASKSKEEASQETNMVFIDSSGLHDYKTASTSTKNSLACECFENLKKASEDFRKANEEIQRLFSSEEIPKIQSGLEQIREYIKIDAETGYALLAKCLSNNKLSLVHKAFDHKIYWEITRDEINSMAPYITRMKFGEFFDFSSWSAEEIDELLKKCIKLTHLVISTEKLIAIPRECAEKLTHLNCSDSVNLQNLKDMPNLIQLICRNCPNLKLLSHKMQKVQKINCRNCRSIKAITHTPSLVQLKASNCASLELLSGEMQNIQELDVSGCPKIKEIISTPSLIQLKAKNCISLELLSGEMQNIQELDVSGCPNLTELPDGIDFEKVKLTCDKTLVL